MGAVPQEPPQRSALQHLRAHTIRRRMSHQTLFQWQHSLLLLGGTMASRARDRVRILRSRQHQSFLTVALQCLLLPPVAVPLH